MSDIRTVWVGFDEGADILQQGADLATENGLTTSVIISLFTDRLAEDDDLVPDGTGDRRGFWGDAYTDIPGDLIGSRLWLLGREKQLQPVVLKAQEYAQEALAWLVEDGIASAVQVTASIVRSGVLGLEIEIDRPMQPAARYQFAWEAHLNAV